MQKNTNWLNMNSRLRHMRNKRITGEEKNKRTTSLYESL